MAAVTEPKNILQDKWIICRTCLKDSENEMQRIFTDDNEYCEQIKYCTGLQLIKHIDLPDKICATCRLLLKAASRFRDICVSSQKALADLVQAETIQKQQQLNNTEELKTEECDAISDYDDEQSIALESDQPIIYDDGDDDDDVGEEYDNIVETEENLHEDVVSSHDVEIIQDAPNYNDTDILLEEVDIVQHIQQTNDNITDTAEISSIQVPPKNIVLDNSLKRIRSTRKKEQHKSGCSETAQKATNYASNDNFICNICHNNYTERSKLTAHMKIHNENKPHECEICHKRFRQTPQLARHMNSHTGNRPYKCAFCEASFADPSTCIKHQRIHTNERPYKCDICNKAFAYSNVLKVHLMAHSGEKPYTCGFCQRKFSQLHHKKSHERSHIMDRKKTILYTDEE